MFCSNCGKQIVDGAKFCSFCGTPVEIAQSLVTEADTELDMRKGVIQETPATSEESVGEVAAPTVVEEPELQEEPAGFVTEPPAEPSEFQWDVNEYPIPRQQVQTEAVNFNWDADPNDVVDRYTKGLSNKEKAEVKVKSELSSELSVDEIIPAGPAKQEPLNIGQNNTEEVSAAEKIDKFYTFSKKNEEFQKLLNKEYDKIKSGSSINQEKSTAEAVADKKFEERTPDPSMEAFLEREGVVKPYEPKPFQSDVLDRIEAQERAKEEARLEEEARQKAIEEARLAAEAEMKAAEEAKRIAEEEARKRAEEVARLEEEEARQRAEEEAARVAEEEARLKAIEEARIAEEEARAAEEAARAKAEEDEARKKAEEEEARKKAEAELKAQQEADKIKAQLALRAAIEEEEKFKAEQERRRQEEENIRNKLETQIENLDRKADSAMAAEEARKVLAHTARMREEEAAKIRAAVAGLKNEFNEPEVRQESAERADTEDIPIQSATEEVYQPENVQPHVISTESQADQTPFVHNYDEQIGSQDIQTAVQETTPVVQEVSPAMQETSPTVQEVSPEVQETNMEAEQAANMRAHQATQEDLSEMAKARAEFLAEFGIDSPQPAETSPENAVPANEPQFDHAIEGHPVTGRETMLSEDDLTATRVVDKAAVLAGLDATIRMDRDSSAELIQDQEVPVANNAANDSWNRFEEAVLGNNSEGFAPKEEPTIIPSPEAAEGQKPGLEDTMFIPVQEFPAQEYESSDDFGEVQKYEKETQQTPLTPEEEAAAAMDKFYEDSMDEDAYGKKPRKEKKEITPEVNAAPAARANFEMPEDHVEEHEEAVPEEKAPAKGGAGRIILKVLLIILIVIFAFELAGIGIKFLAPNSKAAEIIDNQLNKVIHLITGSETDYTIPGAEYEV